MTLVANLRAGRDGIGSKLLKDDWVCKILLSFCMFYRPRLGMVSVSACPTVHSFSSGMPYFYMYTFILCVAISCYWKINLIWFDLIWNFRLAMRPDPFVLLNILKSKYFVRNSNLRLTKAMFFGKPTDVGRFPLDAILSNKPPCVTPSFHPWIFVHAYGS